MAGGGNLDLAGGDNLYEKCSFKAAFFYPIYSLTPNSTGIILSISLSVKI